jgi:DNA processing protein
LEASPISRDDALPWLRLTLVPGVSPGAQRALLRELKTPCDVLGASSRDIARLAGQPAADALAKGPSQELLETTLRWLEQPGCYLLPLGDSRYPRALLDTTDPPTALYAQGRIELMNAPAFAIVGSRNATPMGARDAEAFAAGVSRAGFTVVSGLALGIDAAAHRGGLSARGSSIAVMGTGPDLVYPRKNLELAHELAQRGCLVSEFPMGTPSAAGNFPRRNRLISGLSRGVLVVEAAFQSGSLITAKCALEQGRDVFAVPGSIHAPLAKGCHWLIKEGAKLVESTDDILRELGVEGCAAAIGADEPAGDPLLDSMGYLPVSIDQLVQRFGLDAAKLAARLSCLELDGRVQALAGGWFQRMKKRVIE